MIITRKINGIEFDVNTNEANELYFDEEFSNQIEDGDMNDILKLMYQSKYLPLTLIIEITDGCNFRCPFCYIKNKKPTYLEYDQIINQIDYLIDKGLLFCTITGGECLSHPDFEKIYLHLKEKGVLVSIFTNASLITDKTLKLFQTYKPYKIEISVYGIQNERFQKATNQKKVKAETVLSNILKLKKNGFNVLCKTPVNKLTQEEFKNIKEWMESNNVAFFFSSELFDSYDGKNMSEYKLDDKEVEEYINRHEQSITAYNQTTEIGYREYLNCKAGKYSLYISNRNEMMPCMAFNGIKEGTFDINELGIEHSLIQMSSFTEKYKNKTIKYCKGCNKYKACTECLVTQLKSKEQLKQYMENACKNISKEVVR